MRVVPLLAAVVAALSLPAFAQPRPAPFPAGTEAREVRWLQRLGPHARSFVAAEARREAKAGTASETAARAAVQAEGSSLGAVRSGDIDALVFLVMMEVARDSQADLEQQLAAMQGMQKQKQALRDQHAALSAEQRETAARMRAEYDRLRAEGRLASSVSFDAYVSQRAASPATARDQLKDRLDSQGELGEMESLRLQMAMDRRSKLLETLSNLMKRTSDSDSAILSNLK